MDILSAQYIKSSPSYKDCPPPDFPEYAFIGRSNVGKSSLINMLTGKRNLAKTSATPGKTQLINHFEIISGTGKTTKDRKRWYLVDLPGYGYAKVSQKARNNWDNMIGAYIRKRENLVCLFVLIDIRHDPQESDLAFIQRLGEWEIPFVLLFTKADKSKHGAIDRRINLFKEALSRQWEFFPPFFLTSAVDKLGRKELSAYIDDLNRGFTKL